MRDVVPGNDTPGAVAIAEDGHGGIRGGEAIANAGPFFECHLFAKQEHAEKGSFQVSMGYHGKSLLGPIRQKASASSARERNSI